MRMGQFIKFMVLIAGGCVKLCREGTDVEEPLYQLEQSNAYALSMICATNQKSSQITAKAI